MAKRVIVEWRGRSQSLAAWAAELEINPKTVYARAAKYGLIPHIIFAKSHRRHENG